MEKNILKFFEDAPEALDEAELAKLNELMDEISFVEQFDFPDGMREETRSFLMEDTDEQVLFF